jgi:uncharacterized surface protein with fasciclin (FAS1) repeats
MFNFEYLAIFVDASMKRFSSLRLAGVMLAAVALAACDDETTTPVPVPGTIAATAVATLDLSTLVAALQAADLVSALEGDGPFTVFAPLNSAFAALDPAVLDGLLQEGNVDLLSRILTFHVVPGAAALSTDLSDGQSLTTLEGGTLTVGLAGGGVTVNGANVVTADIEASNGVVHIVDGVLLPGDTDVYETAVLTAGTTTLASAILAAELDGALMGTGPFTVFAPVNDAFDAVDAYTLGALLEAGNVDILTRVLGFHVIPNVKIMAGDLTDGAMVTTLEGGMLTVDLSMAGDPMINGVSITTTDIEVDNGVIHLVDEVILPGFNVVETATITEGFSTLVAAVGAADLAGTLSDETGTFTVFAPTNAAFEALGGTVGLLLETANLPTLADVLTYHVLSTEVGSSALVDGLTAPTVEMGSVTFSADTGSPSGFKINGANITAVDIQTSNGVIHVIDAVLTESMDIVQRAQVTEGTSTLVAAVVAADLVGTLQSDNSGNGFTVFAPTNDAFEALGMTVDKLLEMDNMGILADVLTYHVLSGDVRSSALTDGLSTATVEMGDVTFSADAGSPSGFKINGANITAVDIVTENGVIHLIDAVLTESMNVVERAVVTPETQTLAAAVVAASTNGSEDLAATLSGPGPFTVFAPIEAAFEALGTDKLEVLLDPANAELLSDILRYHVVAGAKVMAADLAGLGGSATTYDGATVSFDLSGDTPMVNGANIIATDIEVENGVIHLIDGVLTETLDIPQVATVNGFSTLVDLVVTAGLAADLSSPNGDFTVFAPTNEAFSALTAVPAGDALKNVLLYHVASGKVEAGDLATGDNVVNSLLTGETFTVNVGSAGVTITDANDNTYNVTLTDVQAENGVIHVIDGVILPTP